MGKHEPTAVAAALPDDHWRIPNGELPAHYCVVCNQLTLGRDYYWRPRFNGLTTEYVHPACLKENSDA